MGPLMRQGISVYSAQMLHTVLPNNKPNHFDPEAVGIVKRKQIL